MDRKVAVYMRLARPMYVALYCRVACADDLTIAMQESQLIRFTESAGYESGEFNVHRIYHDNGESGLTLDRPAMNELTADIRAGRVDAVIIKDTSRISRNHLLTTEWMRLLKKHGVRLVSVTEGILIR